MIKQGIIVLIFSVSALLLGTPFLAGQTVLSADGRTDTYKLITKVLGAGPEVPDCGHAAFGPHITQAMDNQLGKYVFQFHAHATLDNDRCVNFDRQRTEIKTASSSPAALKAFNGDTMNFRWRFKLDAGFQPSSRFTHIHQIKAGDGNAGAPLITLSPEGDSMKIGYFSDNNKSETLTKTGLRPFLGTWLEANETVTFSRHGSITFTITRVGDGKVLLNYHNSDIDLQRSRSNFYRPKWGIYRSIKDASALRDETVLFSEFCIAKAPRVCSEFAASRLPATQTETGMRTAGFSITGEPAALTVAPGGKTTFNVIVSADKGFSGDVTLSADGLPPGVVATFSPVIVKQGGGTATLNLVSDSTTNFDKHTITIAGVSGDIVRTSTVTFIVVPGTSKLSSEH